MSPNAENGACFKRKLKWDKYNMKSVWLFVEWSNQFSFSFKKKVPKQHVPHYQRHKSCQMITRARMRLKWPIEALQTALFAPFHLKFKITKLTKSKTRSSFYLSFSFNEIDGVSWWLHIDDKFEWNERKRFKWKKVGIKERKTKLISESNQIENWNSPVVECRFGHSIDHDVV